MTVGQMAKSLGRARNGCAVVLVCIVAASGGRVFDSTQWSVTYAVIGGLSALAAICVGRARPLPVEIATCLIVGVAGTVASVWWAEGRVPQDLMSAAFRGGGEALALPWPSPVAPIPAGFLGLLVAICGAVTGRTAARDHLGSPILLAPFATFSLLAMFAAPALPSGLQCGAALLVSFGLLALSERLRKERSIESATLVGGSVSSVSTEKAAARLGAQQFSSAPRQIVGLVALVMVVLLPVLLQGVIAEGTRVDVRDRSRGTPVARFEGSPLALSRQLRELSPERLMFEASSSSVRRWRLAVMDRYDGVTWMPTGPVRLTRSISAAAQRRAGLTDTEVSVTIAKLQGHWLPTPSVVTVDLSRPAETDEAVSHLRAPNLIREGDRYTVASRPEQASGVSGAAAIADRDPAFMADMNGFSIPSAIRDLAAQIANSEPTDDLKAQRIGQYLQQNYALDPEAPEGHSALMLSVFLFETKRGSAEQFVAAYALLATAAGLPVRLVAGFETEGGRSVTSSQATAWPEVAFSGGRWAKIDVVPAEDSTQQQSPPPEVASKQLDVPVPPPTTAPEITSKSDRKDPDLVADTWSTFDTAAAMTGAGLLLLLAMLAGIIRYKQYRRRRLLRNESNRERILGASRVAGFLLADHRVKIGQSVTDLERAKLVQNTFAVGSAIAALGKLATRARFSPHEVSEAEATEAIVHLGAFEAELRPQARIQRLRVATSLRSFRSRVF